MRFYGMHKCLYPYSLWYRLKFSILEGKREGKLSMFAILQAVLALIILGIVYMRMIKRETPEPIGRAQAIVPVVLGVASLVLSFLFTVAIGAGLLGAGIVLKDISIIPLRATLGALLSAGLTEEVAKFIVLMVVIVIFKPKNVYECIIAGAGVGFGFTIFEEFLYGGDGTTALSRLITLALHFAFGVIMAKHIGMARHNKLTGNGSVAGQYALSLIIPIILHTLFDAFVAHYPVILNAAGDPGADLALIVALAIVVVATVWQVVVLVRLKKDTQKYCDMAVR